MSNLKILPLYPRGTELFQDSESFLQDLSEQELGLLGGNIPHNVVLNVCVVPVSAGSIAVQTKKLFTIAFGIKRLTICSAI